MSDKNILHKNPIIWSDYPDLDVIRVEDTYYMISTTMHFMPGGVILRSYDLVNWEIATYLYDILENTSAQRLEGDKHIYGQGMWAASLRYHEGKFYICFVANDTHKTYLYQSEDILGPWEISYIEGFYHDASILFDDDDRVYIVYGNRDIRLTELEKDLSGPKSGGLDRIIVSDRKNVHLAYEGAHLYKINEKYYLFLIHWPAEGAQRRTEACYMSDSLEGEFLGKDILDDDMGFHNQGVAQGGIVDTPDGDWYGMLFQDHGAVGRIPVLVPMHWEHDFPVFGINEQVPHELHVKSTRPDYTYEPLFEGDDFNYLPDEAGTIHLKKVWQWNHIPNDSLWSITEGALRLRTGKLSRNVEEAVNTLTQRMMGPACEGIVTINGLELEDGDYAGICALQGCYGFIAITKEEGQYYLVMRGKAAKNSNLAGLESDKEKEEEYARIPINNPIVTLKLSVDFKDMIDEAEFFYKEGEAWSKLGTTHKLHFKLDHFVGCRFGLFLYSTKTIGGAADFSDFKYNVIE